MALNKSKKITKKKDEELKDGEEEVKEGAVLSDGVLDALVDEETAPVDLKEDELVDIDKIVDEEDSDDMDYNPDEW